MKRSIPNQTNTPPGGWRYKVPETAKLIGPFTGFHQLHDQLLGHYNAAGYEPPKNLFELVEQQICEEQHEYCGEAPKEENPVAKLYSETKHTFHAALQCLTTLVSHRAGSGEKPDLAQQEARAQVCVACPKNSDITPCSICNIKSLRGLIEKLAGAKKTSVNDKLKFCSVCHCANTAKVATKHEAIWKFMTESQKENLPDQEAGDETTCWLISEHNEQESKYS